MVHGFLAILPYLVIALVVVLVTWIVSKFSRGIANRLIGRLESPRRHKDGGGHPPRGERRGRVVPDRAVGVFAREFGINFISVLVQWWADTTGSRDMREVRSFVVKAMRREFEAAGTGFPVAQVAAPAPEQHEPA